MFFPSDKVDFINDKYAVLCCTTLIWGSFPELWRKWNWMPLRDWFSQNVSDTQQCTIPTMVRLLLISHIFFYVKSKIQSRCLDLICGGRSFNVWNSVFSKVNQAYFWWKNVQILYPSVNICANQIKQDKAAEQTSFREFRHVSSVQQWFFFLKLIITDQMQLKKWSRFMHIGYYVMSDISLVKVLYSLQAKSDWKKHKMHSGSPSPISTMI